MRDSVKEEIELNQQEKDELADKVLRGRQMLDDYEFSDEASISAYLNNAEEIYSCYNDSKAVTQSGGGRMVPIILFLLAAAAAAGSGYFLYWYFYPYNTLLPVLPVKLKPYTTGMALAIGAAVLLAGGFFTLFRRKRLLKEAKLCTATLSEIFKRHLGDSSISDEAMEALRSRLGEFTRLCQMMAKSEETLKLQTEKISTLRERQNNCSEVIEKQQRIQWELEKKLEHLADCKDRAAALKRIITENERLRQDIAAIDLAQETMQELSMSIRDSFGLYLNKTTSELISGITGGIYTSISIDENLNAFLKESLPKKK